MAKDVKRVSFLILAAGVAAGPAGAQTVVFAQDFESPLPPQISPGAAMNTGVQGYAGLGHPGNRFGGSFLRSPTGNLVTLSLSNLPPHSGISILFLFAAIDSLDGTGTFPEGDYFAVTLDGVQVFRESFANASPGQIQSYVPPPGVELARRVDLGFSGPGSYYTDSAYDLSLDPDFQHLPHTASTATITFQIEGPGIQPLDDESWAMDNLHIVLDCGTPPAVLMHPAPVSACGSGPVTFSALGAGSGLDYRWQIEFPPAGSGIWADLVDGPLTGFVGGSAVASNTGTAMMTITGPDAAAAARYRCRITNAGGCGSANTNPAALVVRPGGYANCDNSTTPPVLNVLDFSCFLNRFAAGDPYANCDGSTTPPVLNVLDFSCFLNAFAAGCT